MSACRSCGAEVQGAVCGYCGSPAVPDPVRAPSAGSQGCPRCESPTELFRHAAAGAVVLGCPGCGGLWVPEETLEPLIDGGAQFTPSQEGADLPRRLDVNVRYLKCPTCSKLMARRNYGRVSGVIVDSCPQHGVWLDRGELQTLRSFVASGGRKRQASADADKERLADQLRELRREAARAPHRGSGHGF